MSIRYLWISIRAVQYTDRAFRAINQNIASLQQAEKGLGQSGDVMKMSAGIMWMALGAMAIAGITTMMRACQEGNRVMNTFDKSVHDLTKSFGEAFTKVLGPIITTLANFFEALSKLDPRILQVISAVVLMGIALVITSGAIWAVSSGLKVLGTILTVHQTQTVATVAIQKSAEGSTYSLGIAYNTLKVSISQCFMVFSMFMMLGTLLGKQGSVWAAAISGIAVAVMLLANALWDAAIPMNMITLGAAAFAGLGAAAIMQNMPSMQTGSRKAQVTGPVLVHAGERVGKESQLKRELGSANTPAKSQTAVTINFSGNIQTKADKEQLKPLILKSIKEALDNKV